MDKDVNGNGQPGLRQDVALALSQLDAIRGAQDERARIDSRRWVIMTVILATLTLLVGIMGLFEANHQKQTGELHFLTNNPIPVVSFFQNPPQVSGGATGVR